MVKNAKTNVIVRMVAHAVLAQGNVTALRVGQGMFAATDAHQVCGVKTVRSHVNVLIGQHATTLLDNASVRQE